MESRFRRLALFPFGLLLLGVGVVRADSGFALSPYPDAPKLAARSAILIDEATGESLFEKNADVSIPPASLTKLMTIHLAYRAVERGQYSLDSLIPIHKEDCYPDLPYRSSLMFLSAGMRVSLSELLLGMAIPSGNDAAFAVARAVSGSIEDFAREMSAEARSMGLTRTSFVEPSGLSEKNETTAREFAVFSRAYIARHPQALADLHSVKSLSFPLLKNMPEWYTGKEQAVTQENRNGLLLTYEGCDGLKTGYIDESGYNIALTASRAGTRLIAVILGGDGSTTASGTKLREENGRRLLDYGFSHFLTVRPKILSLEPVRVWKGRAKRVDLVPGTAAVFTARKEDAAIMKSDVRRDRDPIAPVHKGQALGEIVFSANGRIIQRIPLVADREVGLGNPFTRLIDGLILLFRKR
jgi:D-alanyl-D-alanine carboxypeptidase (penicillin-binding protein 5/6)